MLSRFRKPRTVLINALQAVFATHKLSRVVLPHFYYQKITEKVQVIQEKDNQKEEGKKQKQKKQDEKHEEKD